MRITERMKWSKTQRQLGEVHQRREQAEQRALTGERVRVASDDGASHAAAQKLNAASRRYAAFVGNAEQVAMELERADGAIQQAYDVMARARELSVQFGDSSYGADEMAVASLEVESMRASLANLANTEHIDRRLFGGQRVDAEVVDPVGNYAGSGGAAPREVSVGEGARVVLMRAEEVFGVQGASAFEALDAFSAALQSGDRGAMRASQLEVDTSLELMEGAMQRLGQTMTRTEEARAFGQRLSELNARHATDHTEADFIEAVSTMQQSSTIYELSLRIASDQKQLSRQLLSL